MKLIMPLLVGVLSVATPAWAELGVCFDTARALGTQFYWGFKAPDLIAQDTHCSVVTKASGQTDPQMQLIQSQVDRGGALGLQPATKYLTVQPPPPAAGGLAVLMDAAGMQSVDDFVAAEQAKHQAWVDETQTPGVCKYNTPTEIDTKVDQVKLNNQNNINAMTLVAGDKQQLINVANRLTEAIRQVVTCDAARAGGGH